MKRIIEKHKLHWSKKSFTLSTVLSFTLLFISLFINYFANIYTTSRASNAVTDIILDNIPVYNVNFIFFEGFFIFWVFIALLFIFHPQKTPFVIKSIAMFILIRSVFISLTHLGLPPNHAILEQSDTLHYTTSGNDMFFSSHTGLPFLMSLMFWDNKILRYILIGASFFFGASVLLGHLHYSIDVFAAFFITYGIFHVSRKVFQKDYKLAEET